MTPAEILAAYGPREAMDYDVVVVGAGPAGLATAIRLKQINARSVGGAAGKGLRARRAHHLRRGDGPARPDGTVPDWKERGAPLHQPVTDDEVYFLQRKDRQHAHAPGSLPDCLHNHGNYIISLGAVAKWLAEQAEALGVEIFPGFAAAEVLYNDAARCAAWPPAMPASARTASPPAASSSAWNCCGKYTVFAEGARGHLGKQLIARYKLDTGRNAQTYALGVKELWEVDPAKAKPGLVVHTAGWPMDEAELRRRLPVPPGRQPHHTGPGHRAGLPEPLDQPVRRDAALEDAPRHARPHRRRQAHRLRRARHRVPVA
jgi:electron-transferring-flavoprotein dehydrogenase